MEAPFKENYNYSNCFHSTAVLEAGGIPVVPAFLNTEDALALMEQADGLYLTGGADIEPSLYGEETLPQCGKTEPERDISDRNLLNAALKLEKPVLCVCRGCQLVNACLGGSLYQDLPTQRSSEICHSVYRYPDYAQGGAHTVTPVEGTPLYAMMGPEPFNVNSLHHQGIKVLAPGLKPMAFAPDGLVESWYSEKPWIRGYQWHPEMRNRNSEKSLIFSEFVEICKNSKKSKP